MLTSQGDCDFCDIDEYFLENTEDYFKSECRYCPLGTVGGQGVECVPCDAGTIWQDGGHCQECDSMNICPIGTKYEFPRALYEESFKKIRSDNLPEVFNPDGESVDRTATIVIVSLVFLSIILAALIGIFQNSCKEKSLFVFRELDFRAITGGRESTHAGGVMIVFLIMWILIMCGGILVHFFFFNT